MSPDQGFTDLRLNRQQGQTDEGFWPSFTDIMTVIVMIFLLVMVILLLRNMELMEQLQATVEAEREASALAESTGTEKAILSAKLVLAERQVGQLRAELKRLEAVEEQQEAAIASQRHQITTLSREKDQLSTQVSRLTTESERLNNRLALATRDVERLANDLDQAARKQALTQADLDALRRSYSEQEAELTAALASNASTTQELAELQTDYSDLKIKYDKLVRPARTPKGKIVVEVRYAKVGGNYRIDYKGPGDSGFQRVSRKSLDSKLTALKERDNNLYIKVILPKDSGLSYSEAWSFTNHLHRNYDYYYQEEAQKERVVQ